MVSNQADMTLRGLYYHFKSKDDLFLQLFQYLNSKYYAQIKDEAEAVTDPEEKLKMYARIASKVLNENEAFLKTKNWNFQLLRTWYLYFKKVDYPYDKNVNGCWEWAGIYFGDPL